MLIVLVTNLVAGEAFVNECQSKKPICKEEPFAILNYNFVHDIIDG